MLKPFIKISHKSAIVLLETLAVLALLLAVALGIFVWRVSQGPISIAFARDYVQEALSSPADDVKVTFDDIVFSWPALDGPFLLDLTGLRVQQGTHEANALSIDKASVGLSRRALMFGRIRPKSVIIRSPSLELARAQDGKLTLFMRGDEPAQPAAPDETGAGHDIAKIFKDMAHHTRGSLFARLDEFEVLNASVAVRDYKEGLSWYLTDLNFVMETHPQGVAASVSVPLPGGQSEEAGIVFDMVYRTQSDDFRMSGQVRDINPSVMARFLSVPDVMHDQNLFFTGALDAALDSNLTLTRADFEGAIPKGSLALQDIFTDVIALEDVHLKSSYDAAARELTLSQLSGKIDGIPFNGNGGAVYGDAQVHAPLHLKVDAANLTQIIGLFPKSEHDGEAYEWLGHRIEGGRFSDVALDMVLSGKKVAAQSIEQTETQPADAETAENPEQMVEEEWVFDLDKFLLDFSFADATVTYQDTLMPATSASGKGRLDLAAGDRLDITEGTARIGDVDATGISVSVTNLMRAGMGMVDVKGKLNGPLSTVLDYIAAQPIGMNSAQTGIDPKTVKGAVSGSIAVSLPTIKDMPKESVTVDVDGTVTDLLIPDLVKGLPVSGGPFQVKTEPGGLRVKGQAQLAGRAGNAEWHQYFESKGKPYSMQVIADLPADKELRNHFGVDLDDYITGTVPARVTYTLKSGGKDATVDVNADLTPVRLHLNPFKFEKPAGVAGTASATASLQSDRLKDLTGITIKSRDIAVSNGTLKFAAMNGKEADISSGNFPSITLGKSRLSTELETGKSGALNIRLRGSVMDITPFLKDTQASDLYAHTPAQDEKQRRMNISVGAASMPAENNQSVKDGKAYLELDEDGDITHFDFDGKLKRGDITVRFRPDAAGSRYFRLETNDAGDALYTFGLYENIHGGTLLIYGTPKAGDARGNLYGTMRMENFRVVKAPALASLLSLMSLTGVSQLLGNQGLVFSKLESGFEWRFRPEGNLLIIKDGKTSGSSIGLTFEGVVDRGRKTTDISGTIIPMTEVTSLISKIPLLGNILGGSSGLIAATYSMKGPTSDPRVSVNPLSFLAPGILRRILFEGGYESKIPDDAKKAATPPAAPKAAPKPPSSKGRTVQPRTN